jgi:hypothetical protein
VIAARLGSQDDAGNIRDTLGSVHARLVDLEESVGRIVSMMENELQAPPAE